MAGSETALSVLAAMITPAVLISACGTLLLATTTRLGRSIDRVRSLSDEFEKLTTEPMPDQRKIRLIFEQLDLLTSRTRLLQQIITLLFRAIGVFVATSIAMGALSLVDRNFAWLPVALGGLGALLLFYASMLMMTESRLALKSSYKEMDYLWEKGQAYAPTELLRQYQQRKKLPF
jgi:hypothetical protein